MGRDQSRHSVMRNFCPIETSSQRPCLSACKGSCVRKAKKGNQSTASERRKKNRQPLPTMNELFVELWFYGPHSHVLSVRGAVRLVEWSPAVQKVLATASVPQANASGFPHEGPDIGCSFNLHTERRQKGYLFTRIWIQIMVQTLIEKCTYGKEHKQIDKS